MARAWSPLPQVHEVWARAPLALRLPQVHAAEPEVRAQAPREPLSVLLAHEVEAQAPLAQEHEAEAQALFAQAPSRRQAHPRVKVPLAQAPCWAAVPLAIHLAHVQRL